MSRDLRRYARQTNARLLGGFLFVLVFGGSALVYLVYGSAALPTYLLCLAAGLAPLLLIGVFLFGLERLVHWIDQSR